MNTFTIPRSLGRSLVGLLATTILTAAPAKGPGPSKHAGRGIACAQCHGKGGKREAVPMRQCQTCHDPEALAARTAQVKPTNPHQNRHYGTQTDCTRCHHEHRASENFCLPCHTRFGFKVP
ncbi:MAG: cytochrome c3 family protein [Holophagaceae bacterium]|nr:cytochrome c3 family protein [Holophagaceae bacterium]